MKTTSGQMASTSCTVTGNSHIVDDGDCADHGYFLPKQDTAGKLKSVGNSGVGYVDVPIKTLRAALATLSDMQRKRLAEMQ
jgi:hypothetical protein